MALRIWIVRLLSAGVLVSPLLAQAPPAPAQAPPVSAPGRTGGGGRGAAVRSPEVNADRTMTFRLRAPNARDVSVTGLAAPLVLSKDDVGVWSATTAVLKPDIYEYRFLVDGAAFLDPANPDQIASMSLAYVPGAVWSTRDPNVTHGAVARHEYQSAAMKGVEEYYVYTPPNYDAKRARPYPVLITLHGLGDTAPAWIVRGGGNLTLDNLIAQGKAEPMILVSPHAQGAGNAAAQFPDFVTAVLTEIMPQVQKSYHASTNRLDRAITGLSMGGAQSLLFLNHLDQFAWIGSFSPGFDMYDPGWGAGRAGGAPGQAPAVAGRPTGPAGNAGPPQPQGAAAAPAGRQGGSVRMRAVLADGILSEKFPKLDASANAKLKLLYIVCGTADDHLELTRQFKHFLDERKITTRYAEAPDAGHVWPLWRDELATFAQMVFRR